MQHIRHLSVSSSLLVVALQCWLLVAAAPPALNASGVWDCAPGCACSDGGATAHCEGALPPLRYLPAGLEALVVRGHQLRQLRNDTFAALPQLRYLALPDGRISEVSEGALSALPRLRSLSLANNELAFLPAAALLDSALEALDLSGNPLVLPAAGPLLRAAALRDLRLADCGLRRFSADAFSQLPALRSLDLTSNDFSQLAPEAVLPLANLSWLSVDQGALSEGAAAFLRDSGVQLDVFETDVVTDQPPAELDEDGEPIYLGFLDQEYHYGDDDSGDYEVMKNVEAANETEGHWVDDQPRTGAHVSVLPRHWVGHPSWQVVLLATLVGSSICVSAALAYWAAVLVVRRRSAARSAQGPRDTLDKAFRQVASLPAYRQLQRTPAKPSSTGGSYRRLYDEEESPTSLPPRADQPERCTCLSCSEPVPTQPCIRFYERPASVHGAVPSRYYSLYPTHNQ